MWSGVIPLRPGVPPEPAVTEEHQQTVAAVYGAQVHGQVLVVGEAWEGSEMLKGGEGHESDGRERVGTHRHTHRHRGRDWRRGGQRDTGRKRNLNNTVTVDIRLNQIFTNYTFEIKSTADFDFTDPATALDDFTFLQDMLMVSYLTTLIKSQVHTYIYVCTFFNMSHFRPPVRVIDLQLEVAYNFIEKCKLRC